MHSLSTRLTVSFDINVHGKSLYFGYKACKIDSLPYLFCKSNCLHVLSLFGYLLRINNNYYNNLCSLI